ncbi:aldose 1-epimerase family protein [Novosphingobium umbonatum]|uniref:Aldose 1-epimerase family protein n=1 Tax=Novosphingobium umbonatum TaxID=1908524 RepID=A0A437N478_9SPHN|nr:aldose 1-epimerase family protein [Novosphingobium umbonatum]RVU04717.1 aldose 1-epimerase family protein [Novosphingobium umbonatum]
MSSPVNYLISNEALQAEISPWGAELLSLKNSNGLEYMTDADPAFWSGHAPLLFPIVGSLSCDKFNHAGRAYALPRHGFARRSQFSLVESRGDTVTFALEDSEATRAVYPFAFRLEMAFALTGATLHMTATVHNTGEGDLPFSFGYHPAFAWPLPEGGAKEQHRLVFEQDEPAPIHRVAKGTGVLLPEVEATPVLGRELVLRESLFEADAVIWKDLASRKLTYASPEGPALDISFPDTPDLGLWQVPGARYICIEPWAGHADPQGFDGEFVQKPGIVLLPSGGTRAFRMCVTLR